MSTRLLGQTAASPAPWGRSPPGEARGRRVSLAAPRPISVSSPSHQAGSVTSCRRGDHPRLQITVSIWHLRPGSGCPKRCADGGALGAVIGACDTG